MKIASNFKKYDLVTLQLESAEINNCLIYKVGRGGVTIYPIERYIKDAQHPRATAKIFIPYEKIVKSYPENIKLLFYAVNTKHSFLLEALEHHMKYNDQQSR